jgi:hypothetical protein
MKQNPLKTDSRLSSQIQRLVCSRKDDFCVHMSPLLVRTLTQPTPVSILIFYYLKIQCNVIFLQNVSSEVLGSNIDQKIRYPEQGIRPLKEILGQYAYIKLCDSRFHPHLSNSSVT